MEFSQLLKGVRNLEDSALGHFMEKYSPLVMAFIRKRVHTNDIEDATQEFFYHILKVNLFAKFGGESEDAFKAYLVKSALNFSSDWRSREIRLNTPLEIFDANNATHWRAVTGRDSVHDAVERKEVSERMQAAIQNLDEPYRRVIEYKLLDYSNAEIAQMIGEPLGSVNSWYTRALHKMGDELKDLHIAGPGNSVLQ